MKRTVSVLAAILLAPSLARAGDPLEKAPSRHAKVGDLKVHYKSLGEGKKALVLIHGWSCNLTFWDAQVPALNGKVRVILIDLPGHGKSDRPEVKYTMDLFARAVDAVLSDAGVEEAILAGHSMGTPVMRQYYRLYPRKTKALIAVDGGLRPVTTDPKVIEGFLSQFEKGDFKEVAGKFIDSMATAKTTPELRARIKSSVQAASKHVAISAMRAMMDPALWKEDRIDVPLLAIMAKSPFWGGDYEEFVKKLAPKTEYRVMDGVGHFLHMEDPAAFNEILIGFLKKQGYWSAAK